MHTARKHFVKAPAVQSEINVTPLVDVVLVLLIIFMVVTPLLNRHIAVQLPATSDSPPSEPPPPQWVVGLTPEGRLTLNDTPVEDADYVPRLRKVLDARPRGQRHVFFKVDDRAGYGRWVMALDGARAAGAEELGVLTE
ncbi:ExbD/TolR family protein [Pyxidicoccus fallax]|nr:biopolymer transporter ExbD [Pyxidicoccus fallax]